MDDFHNDPATRWPGIILRAAAAADQEAITRLIREARINPMGLKWLNFLLAVDTATGQVVATGQIKLHGDGSRELASIATRPAHRGRGLAGEIIRRLIARYTAESRAPLYLTCRSTLQTFYEPYGFHVIGADEMPPYFRRIKRFVAFLERLSGMDETLLVMRRDPEAS
jgi:N-acetylglutamate synthase-like GNAT family acetyltransferase